MSHAIYSPSKLEKLEACPCFIQQQFEDNEAARVGTLLHQACEDNNLDLCEDEEQANLVEMCLSYVEDVLAEESKFDSDLQIHNELKVEILDPVTDEQLTYGTADKVIISRMTRSGHVIDYKFGRAAVSDASINLQGQCYAAGTFQRFPEVEQLTVHFVCPKRDEVSTHMYTRIDMDTMLDRIRGVIAECNDPCKVERANETACKYCARAPVCPAMQGTAVLAARKLLPLPESFGPGGWVTPEERAGALLVANALSDWCEKVKKHCNLVAIEEGMEIPGYSLRKRAGSTSVQEVANAIDKVKTLYPNLREDNIYQACSLSLPKLVAQIHAHVSSGETKITKKEVDANVRSELEDFCVTGHETVYLQRNKKINEQDIIKQIQESRRDES